MKQKLRFSTVKALLILGVPLLSFALFSQSASAQLTPIPTPDPKPGSYGIGATKTQEAPTQGATITTPGSGASYTESPITVSGICPAGLIVQIYNNGVMVGSVMCENGSFSLQVGLFAGINELTATVFDDLEQAGPASNVVTVNYTNAQFSAFGQLVTLTSSYGRRSAAANANLGWPLQLSGGSGPYAFSIDWGDGGAAELKSEALAGVINIQHTYKRAGIYRVNVRVVDANGVSAFLQVIAVSSGEVAAAAAEEEKSGTRTVVLWIPAAIAFGLLLPVFWLGRRSQIVSLRNRMLKERDSFKED